MTPCAFDGDGFRRDFRQRKIRELRQFALHHDGAAPALERIYAQQHGNSSGARGAVEHDVHTLTSRDLPDACKRILFLDIDHVIGTQRFGDLHPCAIFGRAGDDDERRARLLADHGLRQSLLARPLNEHAGVVTHATVEE